jgi:hypothetical protein
VLTDGVGVAQHAFHRTASGSGGDDDVEAVSILQQRLAVVEQEIHDAGNK